MQQIVATDLPILPLDDGNAPSVFRKSVFDAWYRTPGGFALEITSVANRHVLIAGAKSGLTIQRTE